MCGLEWFIPLNIVFFSNPLILALSSDSTLTFLVLTHPWLLPFRWGMGSHHTWQQGSRQHAAPCDSCHNAAVSSQSALAYPSSSMLNRHTFINCCPFCCQSPAWSKAPQANRSLSLSKSLLIPQHGLHRFCSLKSLPDMYYFNLMHCKNELWIPIHFGETLQNICSHQLRYKSCVLRCCFQNKILSAYLLAPSRPNSVFTALTHVSDCREVSPALSGSSCQCKAVISNWALIRKAFLFWILSFVFVLTL